LLLLCLLVRDEGFRESIRYSLQGMALLPLFYANRARPERQPLRAMLASRPAVLIGKLSYSLYLYHWLALVVADWVAGEDRMLSVPWFAHVLPALDRAVVRLVPDHRNDPACAAQEVRLACARLSENRVEARRGGTGSVRHAARPFDSFSSRPCEYSIMWSRSWFAADDCLSPRGSANESRSAPARNDG